MSNIPQGTPTNTPRQTTRPKLRPKTRPTTTKGITETKSLLSVIVYNGQSKIKASAIITKDIISDVLSLLFLIPAL
ncbi:hypothetical protein FJZ33_01270 [Candidatus Poribacteria bacterium]|nr:hypothetical protein [Candidatus Poribacteria bacterium]